MKSKTLFLLTGILAVAFVFAQSTNAQPPSDVQQSGVNKAERGKQKGDRSGNRRERPTPEMLIERFDKDGDGKLAVSEMPERMQKRMKKSDTDADGFVSAEELKTTLEKRGSKGKGDRGEGKQGRKVADPAKLIERLDKDGDGKISLEEAPEKMKKRLVRIDANEDGFVELSELKMAAEKKQSKAGNREKKGGKQGKKGKQGNRDLKPVEPKAPPADFEL